MESGLSSALAARSWRIPRLRSACLRIAAVLAMLYAGAIAAWGGVPPAIEAAPQVTEHISKELQQKVYVLDLIPRQCTGKGTSEYFCWEVYPTAWQALDKSRKGISLIIHAHRIVSAPCRRNDIGPVLTSVTEVHGYVLHGSA